MPLCLDPGSQLGGAAHYESFGELCRRASNWTRQQENVRITNVQSIDYKLPHEAGECVVTSAAGGGGAARSW